MSDQYGYANLTRNERDAAYLARVSKKDPDLTVEQETILGLLLELPTDEDRLEVFSQFCIYCGNHDPNCRCWDDE